MSKLKVTTIADVTDSESTNVTNVINGSAKAWVNFNGTGTVAIRRAFNVTSITDNGTGYYTVNLTNAMSDANYSVCVNTGNDATGNSGYRFGWCNASQSAPTTTSFGVTSAYGLSGTNRTSEDSAYLFVAVFS